MSDIISMSKIRRMMEYLGMHSYIIPHYNLSLPMEAEGENYRPEKLFRLFPDGTMGYKGYHYHFNGVFKSDVNKFNIRPTESFLTRAYIELCIETRKKIEERAQSTLMLFYRELVMKVNELEFLNGDGAIE